MVPGLADKSAGYFGVQFLLYSHAQWCLFYVVLSNIVIFVEIHKFIFRVFCYNLLFHLSNMVVRVISFFFLGVYWNLSKILTQKIEWMFKFSWSEHSQMHRDFILIESSKE